MKKLVIALVLAVVVVMGFGAPALAAEPIELQGSNGGTAEWSDEDAAVGDHSVKLDWPAPYRDADNNYIVPRASVAITPDDGLTVGDVSSWSYWAKAPKSYAPNLTFYTDTVADGNSDTTITAWPKNDPPNADVWTQIDETTIGGYQGAYVIWGSKPYPSYKFDWSAVQGSYGDAEILNLLIGKGVIGTNEDITAYVDDFTLNGAVYTFEPPPPPAPKVFVYPYHGARLNVVLPNAHKLFEYHGKAIGVDFSDGIWRIQIPHGTWVVGSNGGQPIRLTVDDNGQILNGITFKYHGDNGKVTVTRV